LDFLSLFNLFIGIQVITHIIDLNVLSRRFNDKNFLVDFLEGSYLSGNLTRREF
jgi:hypothetical protein